MNHDLFFKADHPVTLRWTDEYGEEISRRGRLHRISEKALSIMLPRPVTRADYLRIGGEVTAEAGEQHGRYLTVFRGSIFSIESRLVKMRVDGGIELVERRRFPRAQLPFCFTTTVRLTPPPERYFLSHPVDISSGGVRLRHRLPLQVGERFRLTLRLKRDTTIAPIAEVVDCWEEARKPSLRRLPTTYVSRAAFVDLSEEHKDLISRYVDWRLRKMAKLSHTA